MTKTVKGVLLIVWPIVTLPLVLTFYAISSFIITASLSSESVDGIASGSPLTTIAAIIRVVLGLLGLVSIIGGPISIIFGIIVLAKNDNVPPVAPTAPKQ